MKIPAGRDPREGVAELMAAFAATAAHGYDATSAACTAQRSSDGCERRREGGKRGKEGEYARRCGGRRSTYQ